MPRKAVELKLEARVAAHPGEGTPSESRIESKLTCMPGNGVRISPQYSGCTVSHLQKKKKKVLHLIIIILAARGPTRVDLGDV